MYALCLLAALPAASPEQVWLPRLVPGQELVYRGTVTEEAALPGARFRQTFDLETTLFVLAEPPTGFDLAVLTVLRVPPASGEGPGSVGSVRLEPAFLDLGSVLTVRGKPCPVPLDGPPPLETGVFVAPPSSRLAPGMAWDAPETGRAPWSWRVEKADPYKGRPCWKVVGEQRSDFWDRPNLSGAAPGTLAAWRRRETLWVSPHTGYAVAVERVIERRLAGPEPDGPRLTARFELHSEARYPGQLSDDRRREIRQALAFAEQLATADRRSDTALDVILRRIDRYEDSAQPTPYRVAVEEVRRRAEGYRKGQDPPARTPVEVPTAGLTPGKPAPDFVTMDLARREPWRLGRERGKPVLLLFYDPLAPSAPNVLREARTVRDRLGGRVAAAAVPVRGEEAAILKQRAEVRVDLPVLTREPLPAVYQPPATPRWLILDAGGDLRHASTGWGAETGDVLRAELEACLPRTGK